MKKSLIWIILVFSTTLFLAGETIERIVIEGNKKVSRDTMLFYVKSRENGPYIDNQLRDDFKSLWNTGFFENISIESENGTTGKIVKIIVQENLLISSITYKTGKKIKESDIVDKLQENNIVLMPFSYFNPSRIRRVEMIIKNMLADKGYTEGKVNIETRMENDQMALTINVIQGPKTKIGWVEFPGIKGEPISNRFLRHGMKNNKVNSLLSSLGSKDVFNKDKIEEDLEGVKLKLQEKGYLEAKVGQPSFSSRRKQNTFGRIQNMLKIIIPVEPGPRYKLGNVNIEGNKIIRSDFLASMMKLKKGKTYNIKKRNKILEEIRKIYGSLGYIYAQVVPVDNLDPVKRVADLTVRISEGEIAYVGKLEFKGNTYTRDHVIRREWFLREGGRLNMNALESSITRMKQLGLVTIEKMPEVKPDPADPQKVDIIAEVKELNRQMINFQVGYSGYDGLFVALGYSTQNFMGMGETVGINLQSGTRSKQYSLNFTEPYLFNVANMGFSIYKTSIRIPNYYTRSGEGFNLSTSFRFWRYWGSSFYYSFENVQMDEVNEEIFPSDSYYYYLYFGEEGKRKISSISPTLYYSTVDSPLFPTRGVKYLLSYRYSGGFLGGDVNMHKTKLQFVKFFPIGKRHTFGIQLVYEGIKKFGNKDIPRYERFFLGGEQSIRGFDIYRIGPRDPRGYVFGGNKAFHLNLEYSIPFNQQLACVFFFDMGNAYDFNFPINFKDVYSSMGMELKLFVPMLNVPFRLIFAYNPRKVENEDSNFIFRFAVGPSFN